MKVPHGGIILGQRFGSLTVVGEGGYHYTSTAPRRRKLTCVCDCGAVSKPQVGHLNKGASRSCGAPRKHREAIERKKQKQGKQT